jgi:CheY-like chemotaxis protein
MASARPAPPRPACLLVVADHPDIRAMVREALTEEGYRVCWPRSPSTGRVPTPGPPGPRTRGGRTSRPAQAYVVEARWRQVTAVRNGGRQDVEEASPLEKPARCALAQLQPDRAPGAVAQIAAEIGEAGHAEEVDELQPVQVDHHEAAGREPIEVGTSEEFVEIVGGEGTTGRAYPMRGLTEFHHSGSPFKSSSLLARRYRGRLPQHLYVRNGSARPGGAVQSRLAAAAGSTGPCPT